MSSTPEFLAAVDVGTASARAGIFDRSGRLLGRAEATIATRTASGDRAEQNSEDIWAACGRALVAARAESGVAAVAVAGLAFDATCSLVLRDADGQPIAASPDGDNQWDIVAWFDHRANAEAELATATGHAVLQCVGGTMPPEMQIPKLMWLKRHWPGGWERLAAAYDLADFLAWRATGTRDRSLCTLACKWTYLPEAGGWQDGFLEAVGLGDLRARAALPDLATEPGRSLGPLLPEAAEALRLVPGTPVAAGLIDAHAGALGVLGHLAGTPEIERDFALIAGTSSCIMGLNTTPRPVRGLWGPQFGAILPGLWLTEGGQSVSGALLDHVLRLHGLAATPAEHARVIERIRALRQAEPDLAPRLHVLPDFYGNRSPLGDADALGVISGLPFDAGFDALCRLYWRTCVGIALGLRDILETFAAHGFEPEILHVTGGHTRNPLLMELYPVATRRPTVEPAAPDAVLLGTAMVAATGAGLYSSLAAAGRAMHQGGIRREPGPPRHERDWQAFGAMLRHRAELDAIAKGPPAEP